MIGQFFWLDHRAIVYLFSFIFIVLLSRLSSYVSVNSNWAHPPGQPPGKFF